MSAEFTLSAKTPHVIQIKVRAGLLWPIPISVISTYLPKSQVVALVFLQLFSELLSYHHPPIVLNNGSVSAHIKLI